MTDIVEPSVRSRMMSRIRGTNTRPELLVRKALFAAGFRFRLHRRDLPGVPDVVLPKRRVVVFVHGCFWHRHEDCRYFKLPSTKISFWRDKLNSNVQRDARNLSALQAAGWRVLTVWECAIRDGETLKNLPQLLAKWVNGSEITGEIRGFSH